MSEDKQEMERRGSGGAWVMCWQRREKKRERQRASRRLVNVG